MSIKIERCRHILARLFCIALKWHSEKAWGAATPYCCLSGNHTATCKQHTDEGGSSCSTYHKLYGGGHSPFGRANAVSGSEACDLKSNGRKALQGWGWRRRFSLFHSRSYEQESNVNCTGIRYVYINPALHVTEPWTAPNSLVQASISITVCV